MISMIFSNDMNATYGRFQGIGGLCAVVNEADEQPYAIINDAFGHVKAWVDFNNIALFGDDQFNFVEAQFSGYGPLPGYRQEPLETSLNFLASLGWQGRRIDPNGLYYNGARSYSPTLRIFIAADPLGRSASLDLYSFCGGDPINFVDPDGRGVVSGNPATTVNAGGAVQDTTAGGWLADNVPIVGGLLGGILDTAVGIGQTTVGLATFGQFTGFSDGLDRIGGGLGTFGMGGVNVVDWIARDVAGLGLGLVSKPYTLWNDIVAFAEEPSLSNAAALLQQAVIPNYGFYGGPRWGWEQFEGDQDPQPLNRVDWGSYWHDRTLSPEDAYTGGLDTKGEADRQWIVDGFTHEGQLPGPAGIVYLMLGTPTFGAGSLFRSDEVPLPEGESPITERIYNE